MGFRLFSKPGNTDPVEQGPDRPRAEIGSTAPPTTSKSDVLVRWLYFRGLGLVYLIAFLSLWRQIHGLIGQQGLLSATSYLKFAHEQLGSAAYRFLPTLCWLGSSDLMLHIWCGLGTLLSLALIAGVAPRLSLVLLWAIYLSLSVVGQDFLSFQWDTLLLEMTLCSLLYAPKGLRPNWKSRVIPLACWPLWALAFKLMFLSGMTKLLSGDSSWLDGTALQFHYYTQPIPNWPAWFAYQCPLVLHRVALIITFVIEALLPFLVFFGRKGRVIFGMATIGLMIAIETLGNFGFFNLQTIVLCLPLLNDDGLKRFLPRGSQSPELAVTPATTPKCLIIAVTALLSISLLAIVNEIASTAQIGAMPNLVMTPIQFAERILLTWGKPWILKPLAPFRTINGYGLFRVMTVRRNEIVVETSVDGIEWAACEFPYKPGRIDRAPPIVAPHMPRLDWQMWFAALHPRGHQHWLSALMKKILEGNPTTARLIGHPEFAKSPPKFVRLAYYEYKFTTADQRQATGAWWNRSFVSNLTEAIQK